MQVRFFSDYLITKDGNSLTDDETDIFFVERLNNNKLVYFFFSS